MFRTRHPGHSWRSVRCSPHRWLNRHTASPSQTGINLPTTLAIHYLSIGLHTHRNTKPIENRGRWLIFRPAEGLLRIKQECRVQREEIECWGRWWDMLIDGPLPLSPIGFVVRRGDWPLDLLVINMVSSLSPSEQMCGAHCVSVLLIRGFVFF